MPQRTVGALRACGLWGLRTPSRSFTLAAGFGFRREGMFVVVPMTSGDRERRHSRTMAPRG
jgi:hypothetical protein